MLRSIYWRASLRERYRCCSEARDCGSSASSRHGVPSIEWYLSLVSKIPMNGDEQPTIAEDSISVGHVVDCLECFMKRSRRLLISGSG